MPLPILRSERLLLEPFAAADLDTLHALWTDPDVRRYLWDNRIISRDRAAGALASAMGAADQHGIGYWTLRQDRARDVLGDVGFQFIPQTPDIELMCSLRPQFWNRGLAAEAAQAALEYLWRATPFTRVLARGDLPNERSVRLMERLGMWHYSTGTALITYVLDRPARPTF